MSGWGFASDLRDALPPERSTLDRVPIGEVGPGFIPAGTFALGGNTLCLGDSGTVAMAGGAALGVYSRIDGDAAKTACTLRYTRNVFQDFASQGDLVTRAFAAVGEAPTYIDDPPACEAGTCTSDASDAPAAAAPPSGDGSSCAIGNGRDAVTGSFLALALAMCGVRRLRRAAPARAPSPRRRERHG